MNSARLKQKRTPKNNAKKQKPKKNPAKIAGFLKAESAAAGRICRAAARLLLLVLVPELAFDCPSPGDGVGADDRHAVFAVDPRQVHAAQGIVGQRLRNVDMVYADSLSHKLTI